MKQLVLNHYPADVFMVFQVFENLVKSKKEIDDFVQGDAGAVQSRMDNISNFKKLV